MFESDKGNVKGIWNTIKCLAGTRQKSNLVDCLRSPNANENTSNKQEIAELFNKYFTSIMDRLRSVLPNVSHDFSRLLNFVAAKLNGDSKFKIPAMTINRVCEALKSLKTCKSTGKDNISAIFLKIAAPVIAPSIAKIINMSLETAVFPTRWKTTKVIPLYKMVSVTMLRIIVQYPFCLLSLKLSRGMYMTANDLIYNRQSGFRQFHGTETALIKLIDQLLFDMDNKRITGMVLVDYQKAFDGL